MLPVGAAAAAMPRLAPTPMPGLVRGDVAVPLQSMVCDWPAFGVQRAFLSLCCAFLDSGAGVAALEGRHSDSVPVPRSLVRARPLVGDACTGIAEAIEVVVAVTVAAATIPMVGCPRRVIATGWRALSTMTEASKALLPGTKSGSAPFGRCRGADGIFCDTSSKGVSCDFVCLRRNAGLDAGTECAFFHSSISSFHLSDNAVTVAVPRGDCTLTGDCLPELVLLWKVAPPGVDNCGEFGLSGAVEAPPFLMVVD